jgi:hypothetical protein
VFIVGTVPAIFDARHYQPLRQKAIFHPNFSKKPAKNLDKKLLTASQLGISLADWAG